MKHLALNVAQFATALLVAVGCREMPTSITPPSRSPTQADATAEMATSMAGVSATLVVLPIHCDYAGAKCGRFAYGYAINDRGTVVGTAEFHYVLDLYNFDGAVWPENGDIQRVSWTQYPGSIELISLRGINNRGDLLGGDFWGEGTVFVNGVAIAQPPGYFGSVPVAISEQTEVVGYGTNPGSPDRAFVWTPSGGIRVLEYQLTPGAAGASSRPYDINDLGMAVGVVGDRGVLWDTRQGGVSELAPRFGVSSVVPKGINNKGEIVGFLSGNTGLGPSSGGFFWSPVTGVHIIDSDTAMSINDSSVVVGNRYVWTPQHGRLTLSLPTGGWQGGFIGGKINNRNQLPGWVSSPGYMCCSRAARFDIQLPPPNQPPLADAGGPYSGVEGSEIIFDGTKSSDPEQQALTYAWDFGDGGTAVTAAPHHAYMDNGTYIVRLIVTDPQSRSDTATTAATVANVAPTVALDLTSTISSGEQSDAQVKFSDPGASDLPWQYVIDWGTGEATRGTTNDQNLLRFTSPRYCAAGVYTVRTSVTDKDQGLGSASATLRVQRIPISVNVLTKSINQSANGKLPVAILGTSVFDARQIDVATLRIGSSANDGVSVARRPNGSFMSSIEDLNGDGFADLVVHLERAALEASSALSSPSTELLVRGRLVDGCREVEGTDLVRVIARR